MTDETLYTYMNEMLRTTPVSFTRYMYHRIDWKNRLMGIIGPRGIGKSTMVLQYIRQHPDEKSLYVSADHTYFSTHSLVELADEFVKDGGRRLCIDEVHKYKGWSRELKQIYDVHADLSIVFTGSSVLDIKKGEADLSRRALMYAMQGLSFREYLELFHDIKTEALPLEEILAHRGAIPALPHPLPLFRAYLKEGYYPFSRENGFEMRMEQVIAQTVESDIPQYADMKASTARKLKKMLAVLAQLSPFKPNMDSLAAKIGVSKNNVPEYLIFLERAGMIAQLRNEAGGLSGLGKVEKVYIDNPNLMGVLAGGKLDTGNLRETFFFNQLRVNHDILSSKVSDFRVGGYTFEIGGRSKGRKQIEDIPNGIVVKDDIETGYGTTVPLWQFGLNY